MPKLLVRSPGPPGLALELNSGAYRIGRSYVNDFQIDHPSVSTAHCELRLQSGALLVRDLGSTNGTFIDCQRIQEETLLFGQILQVGIAEFVLEEPLRLLGGLPTLAVARIEAVSAAPTHAPVRGCYHHPMIEASFECPHCQQFYCVSCVRGLSRMNGIKMRLCPDCGNECERTGARPELEAPQSSDPEHENNRTQRVGWWPLMGEWLKSRLIQGLLFQRRQLLEVQDLAARQAAEFDQRLAQIEFEMHERIRQYEQRISELEKELAAAELEKRELIRNQIVLMKRALAEEREKEQFSAGRARSFSCSPHSSTRSGGRF